MFLRRELLRKQIEDVEHDLLQKNAYVAVRWAARKFGNDKLAGHAITRLKVKFPDVNPDNIEEAVFAMAHDARIGEGGE